MNRKLKEASEKNYLLLGHLSILLFFIARGKEWQLNMTLTSNMQICCTLKINCRSMSLYVYVNDIRKTS